VFNIGLLMKVLREAKKTSILDAKSILYQAYETSFGIHDYISQAVNEEVQPDPARKRPLSAVAMHFAEDHSTTSRLYEMMRLFLKHNVFQATGLNWQQFLQLPHDQAEYLLLQCKQKLEKDVKSGAAAMQQFQQDLGRPPQG